MIDALGYTFIQNALIAGILVSITAGIMGSLIVVNRMVFLTGGVAHSSYGGIGAAIYFGIPIFLGASIFAVASALLIAWFSIRHRERTDTFIGLVWSAGMAMGVIFTDLTPGYNSDLMSYLFGSILAVEKDDIVMMAILTVIVVLSVHIWYREILAVSYDREYASLRGIPDKKIYTAILVLASLTVVVAIKVVGLILVIALMSVPTYISERISGSLYSMMMLSALLSVLFTIGGLILSYRFDLTSGACIILLSTVAMALFTIAEKIFGKRGSSIS